MPESLPLPAVPVVLRPSAVFDGHERHEGWRVRIQGEHITAFGADVEETDARIIDLAGTTLTPGLIDLHSHLLLYAYDLTSWNDQVLKEPEALRVARATVHARRTLEAGFTTLRDLGTEGAGDADVGLKRAIDGGIIPGPRTYVVTRAIVAAGTYGPKGFNACACVPQGAEEAAGMESIARVTRSQIAAGADWIKVYGDYGYGPSGEQRPTFSLEELQLIVRIARDAGCPIAVHASTPEGMRRAALAAVDTIEHGNDGTPEVFALMREQGVALVPTLAAMDAITRYRGWDGSEPAPPFIAGKRASFQAALASGVTIANGSDVGVFAHGENARELVLMVEYGLSAIDALRAATRVAADVLHAPHLGRIAVGARADIAAFAGDPTVQIAATHDVRFVMKNGAIAFEHRRTP